MLRAIHRKRVAAIALFAVLFGALSPAFAALKYRGQPEALAQICTTHGLESSAPDGNGPPTTPVQHQIHCAWCSASAAQPGIDGPSVQIVIPASFTQTKPAIGETAPVFSAPVAFYHPQAPPVLA
jgi:hypothetical protein